MRIVSVCAKTGLRKGAWSSEEDGLLSDYIMRYGHGNWRLLPRYAGLARCGKSCRLRWMNYLRPNIKRGDFTKEEDEIITNFIKQFGNRWSAIAAILPGRTDNEIKNYWHTNLKKRTERSKPVKDAKLKSVKCKKPVALRCSNFLESFHSLILESSSVTLVPPQESSDSSVSTLELEATVTENPAIKIKTKTSEIDVELNGNSWSESFLVEDPYLWEDNLSILMDSLPSYPSSTEDVYHLNVFSNQ